MYDIIIVQTYLTWNYKKDNIILTKSLCNEVINLDINQINSFITVSDCGSFSKASEKLYLSVTAIMKQMNMLEKQVGVKLMYRTNKGISLTDAGKSFYKDAKLLTSYYEESIVRARTAAKNDASVVRIGSSILYPCKAFINLWAEISDKYPQFKIQIVPFIDEYTSIPNLLKNLGTNHFDIIVGPCNSLQWLSFCNFYELGFYNVCCAVPLNHRLSSKNILTFQDLYGETLMMIQRGDSFILDSIRDDIEINHPQITLESTPPYYDVSVFNCCEQSGNVLLTLDIWSEIHPSLKTILVDWDYKMPHGILYRSKSTNYIDEFVEAIKNSV